MNQIFINGIGGIIGISGKAGKDGELSPLYLTTGGMSGISE